MKILVLNAGSSSQKSRLYQIEDQLPATLPEPLWEANADWTAQRNKVEISIKHIGQEKAEKQSVSAGTRADLLKHLLESLWTGEKRLVEGPEEIEIVGHRVVHGGPDYRQSVLVTNAVKQAIEQYAVFAPEHNPVNLEGIKVAEELLPKAKQVAVFDTAFHRQLPLAAAVYPGPYEWYERGIQRYGFHGINHQYCAQRTAELLERDLDSLRLIICHLGNGCSLAAVREGHSIDTTMGFTPLEGLMMGSRSGSIDPGILIHLLQLEGYTPDQLNETLNKNSGLKGISGQSSDMRAILEARAAGNERAALAFNIYIHRLCAAIGSMLASLGGLDALVFTAGVGEHASEVRALVCDAFKFLGIDLDLAKNDHVSPDEDVAMSHSATRILVITAQEDWMIARQSWQLVHA